MARNPLHLKLCLLCLLLCIITKTCERSALSSTTTSDTSSTTSSGPINQAIKPKNVNVIAKAYILPDKRLDGFYIPQTLYDCVDFANNNPKLVKVIQIGEGASTYKLPILAFEITQSDHVGGVVVIDGGLEHLNHTTKCASRLSNKIATDAFFQITKENNLSLLSGLKIIIIPAGNIDYSQLVEPNIKGLVDCKNIIYEDFDIGSPEGQTCSNSFFKEPETRVLRDYYTTIKHFKLYIHLRVGTGIRVPFAYKDATAKNMLLMADSMQQILRNYNIPSAWIDPKAGSMYSLGDIHSGDIVDYVHEKLNVPYALRFGIDDPKNFSFYFHAIKYAILQLQLTDPDIADAILANCNN